MSKTVSDKLRASAVAGHRRHPGEQYGGVQRAAGSRHRAADAGWQGDLEGYRHQRRRLVARFTFLKVSPAMIWDAADRPAPFAGRVLVERTGGTDAAGAGGG